MLFSNNSRDNGFSLTELLLVLVIIGIIGAIAAPNLLGFLNRYRVDNAFEELVGAIKETQKQAMRQGKLCRVFIDDSTNLISANPTNCLLEDREISDDITIRTNLSGTPPSITFSHIGNTTKMGTIVLSSNYTNTQRCFVISLGLGISRTGDYTGNKTGSVSATNCQNK